MSVNDPEKPKKGCGCLSWCVAGIVALLLACFFTPSYSMITIKAQQMKASSNARQIIGLLLTYAADYDGYYPDHGRGLTGLTSNTVFRELVKDGLTQDETIFGAPSSSFVPDGDIGKEPGYEQALSPGENHWMMVVGLSNRSLSHHPLVMENAAQVSWPPQWSLMPPPSWLEKISGRLTPSSRKHGNCWKGDTIVIGHNDASAVVVKLEPQAEWRSLPERYLKPEGKEPLPVLQLLDIEVSK